MEMEIVYTAAIEREMVKAQQRTPERCDLPVPRPSRRAPKITRPVTLRASVRAMLQSRAGWWSSKDVAAVVDGDRTLVCYALVALVKVGLAERERVVEQGLDKNGQLRGLRTGQTQRYRWVR